MMMLTRLAMPADVTCFLYIGALVIGAIVFFAMIKLKTGERSETQLELKDQFFIPKNRR